MGWKVTDAARFVVYLHQINQVNRSRVLWPPPVSYTSWTNYDERIGFNQLSVMPGTEAEVLDDLARLGHVVTREMLCIRDVTPYANQMDCCTILFQDNSMALGLYLGQGEIAWSHFPTLEQATQRRLEMEAEWQ